MQNWPAKPKYFIRGYAYSVCVEYAYPDFFASSAIILCYTASHNLNLYKIKLYKRMKRRSDILENYAYGAGYSRRKHRRKNNNRNTYHKYTFIKQLIASILLVVLIVAIKNINSVPTNIITEKIKDFLSTNIDFNKIYEKTDQAIAGIIGRRNNNDLDEENEFNKEAIPAMSQSSKKNFPEDFKFEMPLKNATITSPFGERVDPWTKEIKWHYGIDITSLNDFEIFAAEEGIVEETGENKSYGKYLIINHGSKVKSIYAHCSSIIVEKDQKVKKLQKIAEIGNTGVSTGVHLHFEIWVNDKPVDPINLIPQN